VLEIAILSPFIRVLMVCVCSLMAHSVCCGHISDGPRDVMMPNESATRRVKRTSWDWWTKEVSMSMKSWRR